MMMPKTIAILSEVAGERLNQEKKWGVQHHPNGTGSSGARELCAQLRDACDKAANDGVVTWGDILSEEFAESMAESDDGRLRTELIQCAAVCVAWVEDIDSRRAVPELGHKSDHGKDGIDSLPIDSLISAIARRPHKNYDHVTDPLFHYCNGDTAAAAGAAIDLMIEKSGLSAPECILSTNRVMRFGASKYGADNWKLVPDGKRRYLAAAIRHMSSDGNDPETGEHHMAHAVCCFLILHALPQ